MRRPDAAMVNFCRFHLAFSGEQHAGWCIATHACGCPCVSACGGGPRCGKGAAVTPVDLWSGMAR